MLPLKFDTSDRFACMIHHWKAKNLLFSTMCGNINLVKPFGNYALLNTGSTAKNLRSRHDHNLSAWSQYYIDHLVCLIESQSYPGSCFSGLAGIVLEIMLKLKFVFLQNFHF